MKKFFIAAITVILSLNAFAENEKPANTEVEAIAQEQSVMESTDDDYRFVKKIDILVLDSYAGLRRTANLYRGVTSGRYYVGYNRTMIPIQQNTRYTCNGVDVSKFKYVVDVNSETKWFFNI